jgi:hypothetical protein
MTALTYRTQREKDADRDRLRELLKALSASELALRLDECGAWRINGRKGHGYTWGDGESFVLYVACGSARAWSAAKKRLAFCRIVQDGDDEGCWRLLGLPSPEQAEAIRRVLGIRRRRPPLSPSHPLRQKARQPRLEGGSRPRITETSLLGATPPEEFVEGLQPAKTAAQRG